MNVKMHKSYKTGKNSISMNKELRDEGENHTSCLHM